LGAVTFVGPLLHADALPSDLGFLLLCCAGAHRTASAMNTTDFLVPIMLGVLFALLLALALWLFVDLPLFLPDEG
jgi:protein-S-isoprenylcysteine O-methyltransferase Ste14